MSPLTDITSQEDFDKHITGSPDASVVHFWAAWCDLCNDMDRFCTQLGTKFSNVKFFKVEAEVLSDITEKYGVSAVPTFVLFHNKGSVFGKIEGANPAELAKLVEGLSKSTTLSEAKVVTDAPKKDINERLRLLVNLAPVTVFIKGTPDAPKCGFSRQVIELFKKNEIPFRHFDILSDEEVRQGLKTFSNWPTYPQIYANGKLVGGLDIIKEIAESGELHDALEIKKQESLESRLKKLIEKAPVMLFMKGSPEKPSCGFSRQIVEILKKNEIQFSTFDILSDEDVRQGLKAYSNWPTFPQLYSKGSLVGGLDIVKELNEGGELQDALA